MKLTLINSVFFPPRTFFLLRPYFFGDESAASALGDEALKKEVERWDEYCVGSWKRTSLTKLSSNTSGDTLELYLQEWMEKEKEEHKGALFRKWISLSLIPFFAFIVLA